MLRVSTVLFLFIIFSSPASAEFLFVPEQNQPVPSLTEARSQIFRNATKSLTNSLLFSTEYKTSKPRPEVDVDELAAELSGQFKKNLALLASPAPACESSESGSYTLALYISGQFQECAAYATSCAVRARAPEALLRGAQCEAVRFEHTKADQLFEQATSPRFSAVEGFEEAVYTYASYALYGTQEDQVPKILAKAGWNEEEKVFWTALLNRTGASDTGNISAVEIDRFLERQIKGRRGSFRALLMSAKLQIHLNEFRYTEGLKDLSQYAPEMKNPLLWYSLAYRLIYSGLDQDFAQARKIYDAYNKFANRWWWFPVEQNTYTYTYTEIYARACRATLLQGADFDRLTQIKAQIRSGELAPTNALDAITILVRELPGKADVMTTYGGILALLGRHSEAMDAYWTAHQACPYYNRANWGLTLERRFLKYSSLPDYAEGAARVERELKDVVIPSAVSTYFLNWGALGAETQRRVVYGARIWLPYIESLLANNMAAYIKFAFDLLSESPALADIRDQRIGGVGYPNDNRLWDDVRGVGGEIVVADLAEIFQTVQGDYNLLGHEMAHQFHYLLKEKRPSGADCITKLYTAAEAANNYPDPYSKQNEFEYFAQGVTYFLVPSDSPKRFGLNQSWISKNDPKQLAFVRSIEESQGDLEKISCPI